MARRTSIAYSLAIAELVANRSVTPLELVDATIARIERLDAVVHALDSRDFERARAHSRAMGRRGRGPRGRGPPTTTAPAVPWLHGRLFTLQARKCAARR